MATAAPAQCLTFQFSKFHLKQTLNSQIPLGQKKRWSWRQEVAPLNVSVKSLLVSPFAKGGGDMRQVPPPLASWPLVTEMRWFSGGKWFLLLHFTCFTSCLLPTIFQAAFSVSLNFHQIEGVCYCRSLHHL